MTSPQQKPLPPGWKRVKLGEVSKGKPQYGSGARKVLYDGTVRYVRITDIADSGELKYDEVVSPSVVEPGLFLEPGDLLIARTGSVGRTYIHKDLPGIHQYAGYLIRFRIDTVNAIPEYVYQVTKSDYWKEWIVDNSKTGTLTNINAKQYASFEFPLPPLDEQQRIVARLERQMALVEQARAAAEEMYQNISSLKAAFLREIFSLGKNLPQRWAWVALGEVAHINPRKPADLSFPPQRETTFVPMPSVDGEQGRIVQPEVKPFSAVARGYTYFENRDVLFAKITPCMQNGKHVIADGLMGGFAFGSTEFHVLRAGSSITRNGSIPLSANRPFWRKPSGIFGGQWANSGYLKVFWITCPFPCRPWPSSGVS